MASGKQLGEYSSKLTAFVNTAGPGGSVLRQCTWEGIATGFGTVFVTVTYSGSAKGGTFTDCSTAFMDNGDFLHSVGQGTYENKGTHKWRTAGFFDLSDGRRMSTEGEIDFAERTWKAKIFEIS